MLIYVAHTDLTHEDIEHAAAVTRRLQYQNPADTFVCPVNAFSHLRDSRMTVKEYKNLRHDLLSACDMLLVASFTDRAVREDIACAKLLHKEVRQLGKN